MHAAPHFRIDSSDDLADFIDARHFATLVVASGEGPIAAHLPMFLIRGASGEPLSLEGHVARNNPLGAAASQPVKALAIFMGPDAYVTPQSYPSKREHGRVVPTWNYTAVHVGGTLETFSDASSLRRQVSLMTDVMERPSAGAWKVSDAPEDYLEQMIRGITGVRLTISSLEGIAKLSQNRPEPDRAGVVASFLGSGDPSARRLAEEMIQLSTKTEQ